MGATDIHERERQRTRYCHVVDVLNAYLHLRGALMTISIPFDKNLTSVTFLFWKSSQFIRSLFSFFSNWCTLWYTACLDIRTTLRLLHLLWLLLFKLRSVSCQSTNRTMMIHTNRPNFRSYFCFIISASTTNSFKNKLDKFWSNQDLIYDYRTALTGIGNRKKFINNFDW